MLVESGYIMGKPKVDKNLSVEEVDLKKVFRCLFKPKPTPFFRKHGNWIMSALLIIICLSLGIHYGWLMGKVECQKVLIALKCEIPYEMNIYELYRDTVHFNITDWNEIKQLVNGSDIPLQRSKILVYPE